LRLRGVALARRRAQERSTPVPADFGLLPNHCAVEPRTVTREDLKQLHDWPQIKRWMTIGAPHSATWLLVHPATVLGEFK
jgi:hypothetical protein